MKYIVALSLVLAATAFAAHKPIALHPDNPHYFIWRGKPTVLITSGEHYGAVLNLDFNYKTYLKELESKKLNSTRTFAGSYVEPLGAFNIADNSMAPASGRFICPWSRSDQPGYANGGNKFDLRQLDENYFRRLRDFVKEASQRGVVVEMNLFCPMYEDSQWKLSPQNAANNINSIGDINRTNVYTLDKNGALLTVQEAMTRKVVTELNEFDNLYFEICNEPYFGGVTMEWQHRIADVIVETEKSLPNKHLISQNIQNGWAKVVKPHPAVSIFNFHYASPPRTVTENYALNKVIGDNETGFKGTNDTHYRMEAWEFILNGGALYNNLDYSFTVGHERGDYIYPVKQPGGGNPEFRRQMTVLRNFINGFDFVKMTPNKDFIGSGIPAKYHTYAMAEKGRQYAAYFFAPTNATPQAMSLTLFLPTGNYRAEWIDPVSGKTTKKERVKSPGAVTLTSPEFQREMALAVRRVR